jgi:hypothetical protein
MEPTPTPTLQPTATPAPTATPTPSPTPAPQTQLEKVQALHGGASEFTRKRLLGCF